MWKLFLVNFFCSLAERRIFFQFLYKYPFDIKFLSFEIFCYFFYDYFYLVLMCCKKEEEMVLAYAQSGALCLSWGKKGK